MKGLEKFRGYRYMAALRTVRVSVSWFTKEEEILAFLEAAGQIAVSLRGAD